jgi:hypothetical protein
MKEKLVAIAKECIEQGPGFAQENVVLREAFKQIGLRREDLAQQQKLLTIWHDLFRDGTFSWGFDIDNPSSPFFHIADRS